MRRAVWLVLLAGCGFRITGGSNSGDGGPIDGDVVDGDIDADPDAPADAMIDGPPLQATCMLAWLNQTITFNTPVEMSAINNTSFDRDPFVSPDEKTIWWSNGGSDSNGGGDIFSAARSNITQPFTNRSRDDAFNDSGGFEAKMSMTTDGQYMVIASTKSGGAGMDDIWEKSRPNTSASWGSFSRTHVMTLETANAEHDPFVTPDGLHLYYAPDNPAPQHIVVSSRASRTANFGAPTAVAAINTAGGEADPMLFGGDRVIVFSSGRASGNDSGNIWYATRSTATAEFGTPVELTSVNSDFSDGDPHVSSDGCRIYFARDVPGGNSWELFSASAAL